MEKEKVYSLEDTRFRQVQSNNNSTRVGGIMSIVDNKTVDGIALTDDNNGIILLIADHMDWRDEYQHLVMLQEKINVYITFLEQKQYEDIYKGENITYGIIEIHFLYNLTANAEKFLQSVQNQVAELGVKIQYCVSQEGADEAR